MALRYAFLIGLLLGASSIMAVPEPVCVGAETSASYQNPSEGILQLRVQNETLSVNLKDAPISKVLEQVSRQRTIRIVSEAPIERNVTIAFDGLPLDKGLRKILRGQDVIFLYSKAGEDGTKEESASTNKYQLTEVRIIGQPQEKGSTRPVSTPSAKIPRKEAPPRRSPLAPISRDRLERPPPLSPPPQPPPPPAESTRSREQAEKAIAGLVEGNLDTLQDIVKDLKQDSPQLQQQIDQFMDTLQEAKERAEKEGTPFPPMDHMGAMGPLMNQMIKDRAITPPTDVQQKMETQTGLPR